MNALQTSSRLVLEAQTAADLMTSSPVSIRRTATVAEATLLLTSKGISGAPVIDDAGRPIGVLTQTDLVIHNREHVDFLRLEGAANGESGDPARADEIMTPAVFAVAPDAPVSRIVDELVSQGIHRLFVVDKAGVLVGVISAVDILRALSPEQ